MLLYHFSWLCQAIYTEKFVLYCRVTIQDQYDGLGRLTKEPKAGIIKHISMKQMEIEWPLL